MFPLGVLGVLAVNGAGTTPKPKKTASLFFISEWLQYF
jgi:hypothetical protein